MKWEVLLSTTIVCLAASVGLGFTHPFGNPRLAHSQEREALLEGTAIPKEVRSVLVNKCADCHSEATRWPAYARVAPGSWLIERDVIEGRRHMNLSRWTTLSPEEQQVLTAKIGEESRHKSMPPLPYRLLHRNAWLTAEDIKVLASFNKSAEGAEPSNMQPGNAERGEALFNRRCTGCHAVDTSREGPKLRGVFGRKAGSVAGFSYSAALRTSGVTWSERTLDIWLSDTDAFVPQNEMGFRVPKAAERADIIAYLKQIK